jgi:hypothetical protein
MVQRIAAENTVWAGTADRHEKRTARSGTKRVPGQFLGGLYRLAADEASASCYRSVRAFESVSSQP